MLTCGTRGVAIPAIPAFRFKTSIGPVRARFFSAPVMNFPWVDGLSAYALAVFGTDPDAATQYRQNEFDANLQWGPTKGILKGLSVRLRYAVVQQFGGDVHNLTDFRTICNYEIKF